MQTLLRRSLMSGISEVASDYHLPCQWSWGGGGGDTTTRKVNMTAHPTVLIIIAFQLQLLKSSRMKKRPTSLPNRQSFSLQPSRIHNNTNRGQTALLNNALIYMSGKLIYMSGNCKFLLQSMILCDLPTHTLSFSSSSNGTMKTMGCLT